jgi:hypothetical protein
MSSFNHREILNQENNEGIYIRPISIRFNKIYTNHTKYYMINPNWTIQQLYEFIKPYILIDFELNNFCIIQNNYPLSENSKLIPILIPIPITNTIKINEMFKNLNDLSFYIKN